MEITTGKRLIDMWQTEEEEEDEEEGEVAATKWQTEEEEEDEEEVSLDWKS